MGVLWQQIMAGAVVVTAAAYLFRHYWKQHQKKSGCPSCKLMQAAQSKTLPNKKSHGLIQTQSGD